MRYFKNNFSFNSIFEITLILFCIFITISRWLSAIQISPDSTAYILAAKSFANHGSFLNSVFTLTDAPTPIKETLYNVYPIGFPSILVLFLWIFKDLIISIAVLQSLIFIFMYFSLNTLLNTIKIPYIFKVPIFLFLLSSRIYQENFTYFLTKPLFISINILMVDQSIKFLQSDTNSKRNRALILFTFLAFLCPLIHLFNAPFLLSSFYYRLFSSNFIFFTTSVFLYYVFCTCILTIKLLIKNHLLQYFLFGLYRL